ncbi:MAG: hypothetical protein ACI865_000858 [Flavobacteriaceae bacterium]|jgi:hypothetical protein
MAKEKDARKTQTSSVYDIPVKGSLGLLAAGDRGLRAWRQKRDLEKDKKS